MKKDLQLNDDDAAIVWRAEGHVELLASKNADGTLTMMGAQATAIVIALLDPMIRREIADAYNRAAADAIDREDATHQSSDPRS